MRTWRRRKNFAFVLFALHVWCLSTATEYTDSKLNNTQEESSPDKAKQRGEAARPERYGTTVPLLLKGEDRRPFFQRTTGSYPASLQLLVHAEGEQLILLLQKNDDLSISCESSISSLRPGACCHSHPACSRPDVSSDIASPVQPTQNRWSPTSTCACLSKL